jgi:membrane protease YdiL (CAAX protease family)
MDDPTPPAAVPSPDDIPAVRAVPAEAIEYPTAIPVLPPGAEPPPVMPAPLFQDVQTSARVFKYFAFCIFGIAVYVTLLLIPGETQVFASIGLEILPFAGLALLAYTADRYEAGRLLTVLYWIFLVGLIGAVFLVMAFNQAVDPAFLKDPRAGQAAGMNLFIPGGARGFGLCVLATAVGGLIGLLCFTRRVRRFAATVTPTDAESFVHATALATVLAVSIVMFAPVSVFGEAPMSAILRLPEAARQLSKQDLRVGQSYVFAWMLAGAVVAVGYPVVRTFRGAFDRLGFIRPSIGQIVFGLAAGVAFVALMGVVDLGIGELWKHMGWPATNEKEFEGLIKSAINPLGAVVIGVTAGLGEELIFRGVLQPRVGILLANLLFTAMHAVQYNLDGLLSVFIVGLLLGVVRKLTNTTTSAIAHGLYDLILLYLAFTDIHPDQWLRQHMGG